MSGTKEQLRERIRRDLGYPYVKVELSNDHMNDAIRDSVHKYKEGATGNANEEIFFTIPLSAGKAVYDMPVGTLTVVDYSEDAGYYGGVNQLFTVENYLYNLGYINPYSGNQQGNLITYHLALNFLDMFRRYAPNKYTYRYHKIGNQLEIIPTPSVTSSQEGVLVRAYMLRGASTTFSPNVSGGTEEKLNEELYDDSFVRKYALALAKEKLGYIRRKFANFQSIGNTGISLDGDQLIQEAREEKERLEEELHDEYTYEGWGISVG